MDYHELESINRRVYFSGEFKYKLFKMCHRITERPDFFRTLELCAQLFYDTIESIRNKDHVHNIGHPNLLVSKIQTKIIQHPKYRMYYHNQKKNSTVGMHIGVDIIKNNNKYYPIDLNLKAYMGPERRELYSSEIDPFFMKLNEIGTTFKYKKIVCFADYWSREYLDEIKILNKNSKIQFILASPHFHNFDGIQKLVTIPDQLEENTLYIVFHPQHSPLDFYITNQSCTSRWLYHGIKSIKPKPELLRSVESNERYDAIQIDNNQNWPNLVIKLGGGGSADFVKVAKINTKDSDKPHINLSEKNILSSFKRNIYTKLKGWAGQHHKLVFQKFIPPEINSNGCAQIIRSHILVTPAVSSLLSSNLIVSDILVPEKISYGIIEDDSPYIVNLAKKSHFENIDSNENENIENASLELCSLIYNIVSEKFIIFENNNI